MKWIVFTAFSTVLSFGLILDPMIPFGIIIACVYTWLLLKHPEIALFICFLVIIEFYSMMDQDFLRIPHLFRIRDLFFISTFIPVLLGIFRKREDVKTIWNRPMSWCILLIQALFLVQVLYTKIRFPEESFNSIFRIGRKYMYYAFYFPALYVFLDRKRFERFMKLMVFSAIVFSFIFVAQFVAGASVRIIPHALISSQVLQGFQVTRIYARGRTAGAFIFQLYLMFLVFKPKHGEQLKNIFVATLTGIQNMLTFGRAHIFGIVSGSFFGILCAFRKFKTKNIIKIIVLIACLICTETVVIRIFFPGKMSLSGAIYARMKSTYNTLVNVEGTIGYRIQDSYGRIELIKKNPVFGIGFVHDESNVFWKTKTQSYTMTVRTSDSGIITLLLDFGLIGLFMISAVSVVFLLRAIRTYRALDNPFLRALCLGIISFYSGRIFCFVIMPDFVNYYGIVLFGLSFAMIEMTRIHGLENT
jgi:hypothetical protein